jgi:hypothetical protein
MKYYVQLCCQAGQQELKKENMYKDDFYTLLMSDSKKNKGIRKQNPVGEHGTTTPTFCFTTKEEQNNFINYLKTDLVRFCMAVYKNSQTTYAGEMTLIPYLDFTQQWNDEKLFKYFNVDKETQNYIKDFLPDHHGIRI